MAIKQLIRPCADRLMIRRKAAETEIKGFIVPDQNQEKPAEGFIVAIGPETFTRAMAKERGYTGDTQTFDIGDEVLFGKYAGIEVTINGDEQFMVLKPDEIIGVLVSVEVPDAVAAVVVEVAPTEGE